jgi:hypothetical protein
MGKLLGAGSLALSMLCGCGADAGDDGDPSQVGGNTARSSTGSAAAIWGVTSVGSASVEERIRAVREAWRAAALRRAPARAKPAEGLVWAA